MITTLAYIITILLWPIVFLLWHMVFAFLNATLFLALIKRFQENDWLLSDIFQAISSTLSQVIVIFISTQVLSCFSVEASYWLIIVYAICCLFVVLTNNPSGQLWQHFNASMGFGLITGLIVGTYIFLSGESKIVALTFLFWSVIVIQVFFGLRNILTVIIGKSLDGELKPGQRLCHTLASIIYWGACVIAISKESFIPLLFGALVTYLFRRSISLSGLSTEETDSLTTRSS